MDSPIRSGSGTVVAGRMLLSGSKNTSRYGLKKDSEFKRRDTGAGGQETGVTGYLTKTCAPPCARCSSGLRQRHRLAPAFYGRDALHGYSACIDRVGAKYPRNTPDETCKARIQVGNLMRPKMLPKNLCCGKRKRGPRLHVTWSNRRLEHRTVFPVMQR
jgi:hypothetical protein